MECRETDTETIELLRPLYDIKTGLHVIAERSFLKTLGGGCSAPVAVRSTLSEINDKGHTLSLTGAIWSLDGKEELSESSSARIEFSKTAEKCSVCPYNSAQRSFCGTVKDIEGLCPFRKENEGRTCAKKPKLEGKVPVELLKDDPHEKCPVEIPIGLDFMGKCPYLESDLVQAGKCPVKGLTEDLAVEERCPFLKNRQVEVVSLEKKSSVGFCGLVPHKDVPVDIFETSLRLGEELALNLMKRGAKEIMSKAQECVRGGVS